MHIMQIENGHKYSKISEIRSFDNKKNKTHRNRQQLTTTTTTAIADVGLCFDTWT